jgi:NAD(P)-dependent dehydrogenase (short-subunit alcohol dehydrogenase family)
MADKVALVAGVGRGTGGAVARRFAEGGYRVALVARSEARLKEYEAELPGSLAIPCDITDPAALDGMLARCRAELGEPEVVVHNAARGMWGSFLDIDPAEMEANFQVNTMSLLHLGRAVAPAMVARGHGAILVTGNTSAWRGKADFAGFAPTKAAQRILAEAMARELGPKGVHVAYVVIDAIIDIRWTRRRFPDLPDERFAKPAAIAETVYQVAHQDPSAWSFNVEVRPAAEVW